MDPKKREVTSHQDRGESEASQDVFSSQQWILLKDILDGITSSKKFEDGLCRDPGAFDGGLAVADVGLNNDAIHGALPLHGCYGDSTP
jgi:hypothetical protein